MQREIRGSRMRGPRQTRWKDTRRRGIGIVDLCTDEVIERENGERSHASHTDDLGWKKSKRRR